MQNKLHSELNESKGYYLGLGLSDSELKTFQNLVRKQWLDQLSSGAPEIINEAHAVELNDYHLIADKIEHASFWPKLNRILPTSAVTEIRKMGFFKTLESTYGPFIISDEEEVGREEIYWRLVRPQAKTDVGPAHADRWFWDLGHGTTPQGCKRIKVWLALFTTPPSHPGLEIVAGSHLKEWKYGGEMRGGFLKPIPKEDLSSLDFTSLGLKPGEIVVFNDGTIHRGAFNDSNKTRVSAEFTFFVKE